MRVIRFVPLLFFGFLFSNLVAAQEPPPRDLRAVAALRQSFLAMGGSVPADSAATGRVTLVEGSKTETGKFRVLTRGANQTAEVIDTSEVTETAVYSGGNAGSKEGTTVKPLQLELAVTSQSGVFPLVVVAEALSDSSFAFEYVGLEDLDGSAAHHIRFWRVFVDPAVKHLEEFSSKDLWIDGTTALPRKLAFVRRAAAGATPGILTEVTYSDFRNLGGVLYPFQAQKSLNGTPWATITIDSVALNTGLTDRDFPTR